MPQYPHPKLRPAKTLIPIMPGADNESLLRIARALAEKDPVLLLGVVPIQEKDNLSTGTQQARQLRALINQNIDRINLRAKARMRVTFTPWEDIRANILEEKSINLLILDWSNHLEMLRLTAAEILSHPPCDVALLRGPFPDMLDKVIVYNRGGPHAERALDLSIALTRSSGSQITSLNAHSPTEIDAINGSFSGMAQILADMPDILQREISPTNDVESLLESTRGYDLIILGTAAYPTDTTTSFGEITDEMFHRAEGTVMAVKTKRVVAETEPPGTFGAKAISVLVDRWFAENTFHADEFADLRSLARLKSDLGLTISVALPALNEEETIGEIIYAIQQSLMERHPLVDELVLMDSNSKDRTREIAHSYGIPVYIHQEVLPQYTPRSGKGEALWKSLYVTEGDLIIWVDTDIKNFHPRFIYGLIGPLLHRTSLKLIKGFYRRPLRTSKGLKPGRGGRVTELTARPLLNLLYPGLSGIIQPLSGEYGGRRDTLERMVFSSGYGVETCLLIEAYEKFKLSTIAQVDLQERIHRNQDLKNLGKMSFAIIQTIFHRLERRYGYQFLKDVNRTMKIVNYEAGIYKLDVEEIWEHERPPMIEIPEYLNKRGLKPTPSGKEHALSGVNPAR